MKILILWFGPLLLLEFANGGSEQYLSNSFYPQSFSLNNKYFGNSYQSSAPLFSGGGINSYQTPQSLTYLPAGAQPRTTTNPFFTNTVPPPPAPTEDPSTLGCGTPPAFCPKTTYRSFDGSCNNLQNPVLGMPQTRYSRLLPAIYSDGETNPPTAKSGQPLPGARLVSLLMFPDVQIQDPKFTLATMQYGQIITHDMSMIAGSVQTKPHQTRCCTDDGRLLELGRSPDHCFPIILPNDDPAYGKLNQQCMNFVRTITDRDRNCVGPLTPAEQLTQVNHFLDLSIVYGNSDQLAQSLRTFSQGKMITLERGGQQWPPQATNVSGTCDAQSNNEPCYMAGDVRVNQNPQLTILQIVFLREHNRIADVLGSLNPFWSDETIFQEARKINIAQHQHITYYEWLPIFLGNKNSYKNKIIYETHGYVDDYDPNVNPSVINEHSTAAFRFFHGLIAGHLDLVTEHRNSYSNVRLSDWFNRPILLEQNDNFDKLTRGMTTQPEMKANQYSDSEITQFLFRAGRQFGGDLRAIDVQRNRDHALATYNDFRHFCGLRRAHTFEDFLDVISADNVKKLATLYESPDDVDLTVGGSLENLVPGTLAGPVNLCILTEQFYRTRAGDRFFYENGATGNGFTIEQLKQIRKASISRLLCDNAKDVSAMQPRGFLRISHENEIVSCDELPVVDLSYWKDQGGSSTTGFGGSYGGDDDYFKKK